MLSSVRRCGLADEPHVDCAGLRDLARTITELSILVEQVVVQPQVTRQAVMETEVISSQLALLDDRQVVPHWSDLSSRTQS